ncbi:EKC/KEOPS complex subunit TP53RK [Neocloeon triangulifer]|uniref:EKC/KEOPS complex subunit TP53RK n=1 Tax=Neocloeon triangulifer TaxID=2078957 RepID=UPI00286EC6E0|nr:EKC/KEOPS complex subunit TP53RK [Neocloeon triangulifer]
MTEGTEKATLRALKKMGVKTGPVDLKDWELYRQGAEARVYKGSYDGRPSIAKLRFPKGYRHPVLNSMLSSQRLRSEVKRNLKCRTEGILAPEILLVDVVQCTIVMEEIGNGRTLKQKIKELEDDSNPEDDLKQISSNLGYLIGRLHGAGMVHGDLTTSNVLLNQNGEMVLIDFGLGGGEASAEDKAVDIYVLERALSATHPNMENYISLIVESYIKNTTKAEEVVKKLEDVRLRGRKRSMVG